MTRMLDIRLTSSGQFDGIRRIESLTLLLLCAVGLLVFEPYVYFATGPLLITALMLVPGKRAVSLRETHRLLTLNALQESGLSLRGRWRAIEESPLSEATASERWNIQKEALIWISECKASLAPYPEMAGIFQSHERGGDAIEELDSCIAMLSRLRRLVNLSERLSLPI